MPQSYHQSLRRRKVVIGAIIATKLLLNRSFTHGLMTRVKNANFSIIHAVLIVIRTRCVTKIHIGNELRLLDICPFTEHCQPFDDKPDHSYSIYDTSSAKTEHFFKAVKRPSAPVPAVMRHRRQPDEQWSVDRG